MKIVLASPLYPPDIAEPAPYTKEVARRLSANHKVTVVTYGCMPEEVQGVSIVAVDKRTNLLVRLWRYTRALLSAARTADAVYFQNGPSVELPVAVLAPFVRCRFVAHIGDAAAHRYAAGHTLRRTLERIALRRAVVLDDMPLPKPEILPFAPRPTAALEAWEQSWQAHTRRVEALLSHAT